VELTADKITRPLRHNGINVVMLWSASVVQGYARPLWLTFKQAHELGGHVKKGERGELSVYADRIRRTETDEKGGKPPSSRTTLRRAMLRCQMTGSGRTAKHSSGA
jgi:antirestriction protein ArdC